jgi:hypothetical protein
VGRWQRAALLTAAADSTDVVIQLHRVAEPVLWDERGLLLAGIEYEWARKRHTAHRQSWLIKFGDASRVKGHGIVSTLEALLV